MEEDLLPLDLPPGLVNNGTTYQTKGRWYKGHLVRFSQNRIMPWGGWASRALTGATIQGVPRAAVAFFTLAQSQLVIGTTHGLYSINTDTNVVSDISPAFGSFGNATVTWQLDVFDTFVTGCVGINGRPTTPILYLGNPAAVAVLGGSAFGTGPTFARAAIATAERFIVFLGTTDAGATLGQIVRWPSQETTTEWDAAATNSAGDIRLATIGDLAIGKRVRSGTLLWTDSDLWLMTYIGGTFVHSFTKVGDFCGVIAHNAVAIVDTTTAYWMGRDGFYAYDSFVKRLPCDVSDYVFGNINIDYAYKIWALVNPAFSEIVWFYPSANATEIDSYVALNYAEGTWSFGALVRTCGVTRLADLNTKPVLVGTDATVYDHETGTDRDGVDLPYLESGPVELGNGDRVMKINRIVPDEKTAGDVRAYLYTSMFPNGAETTNGPYTLASPTSVRLTARQARLKLEEVNAADWRVGVIRLGVREGGRR